MPWWNTESEEFDAGDLSTSNRAEEQAKADYDASIDMSDAHRDEVISSYTESANALDSVVGEEWSAE